MSVNTLLGEVAYAVDIPLSMCALWLRLQKSWFKTCYEIT